jgi:hypothetical protein
MSTFKIAFAVLVMGAVTAGATGSSQAAPLPTHVAAIKSMLGTDAVEVRWGGWGGGFRGGGWGYRGWGGRGWGGRGWGYRPYGWGAAAAGAVIGGALVGGAYYGSYYGSYPYYGGGYAYENCPPYGGYGYGGYAPAYSYGW